MPLPLRTTLRCFSALGVATLLAWSPPVRAQVSESERAAARQLFAEGDQLQRAGKFAEALDKFQRAQQVFSAPTNMLRIAECDAALGHLVESAESYRALVRTPLPAGSPAAFQAAVDQAKGELAQVEPRVPKVIIQLDPPGAPGPQLQIDGQAVPAALLGEAFPLDPGSHRIVLTASGFVSGEQTFTLRERESRTVQIALKPIAGISYAPGNGAPPPPPPAPGPPDGAPPPTAELPAGTPPPPPPVNDTAPETLRKRSRPALVLGVHVGVELPEGQIPTPAGNSADMSALSGGGVAYALDAGVRFARHWYVGLTLEHAALGGGKDPSKIEPTASALSSNTTTFGAVLGFVVNPDRASFFGEAGLQGRWYNLSWTDSAGAQSASYSSAEVLLGMGLWLPAGGVFRLLPELTVGLGGFNQPSSGSESATSSGASASHWVVMAGLGGLFNVNL